MYSLVTGIHTHIWLEKSGLDIWMHNYILDSTVIHITPKLTTKYSTQTFNDFNLQL
jgi:hypothetical protein